VRSDIRGFSLTELLTVLAIIGIMVGIALPSFAAISTRRALNASTAEFRAIFHLARMKAIAQRRNHAIKFRKSGELWTWSLYQDGDWDGVRNDDITAGIDRLIDGPHELLGASREVRIGIASPRLPDPDTGAPLGAASPVRFNVGALCSFSMRGTSTAGTLFLTTTRGDAALVRVYGATGKIRSMIFNPSSGRWEPR